MSDARRRTQGPSPTPARAGDAPKRGMLTRETAEAHRRWVRGGSQTGEDHPEDRLDVVGYDAREQCLDALDIRRARLTRVDLRHSRLEYSLLEETGLLECNFQGANVISVRLRDAFVTRCSFINTRAMGIDFQRADLRDCTFDGSAMNKSHWVNARCRGTSFREVEFGNSLFDRAIFRNCDFSQASFKPTTMLPVVTMAGAVFDSCDFRGAYLTRVDLSGATFRNCRFAGAYGIPTKADNLTVIDCDLSADAAGTTIAGADALLEYLATRSHWPMDFTLTGEARFPYEAWVEGQGWLVRINEFPAEPSLYTLFIDGEPTEELTEWPAAWQRPVP